MNFIYRINVPAQCVMIYRERTGGHEFYGLLAIGKETNENRDHRLETMWRDIPCESILQGQTVPGESREPVRPTPPWYVRSILAEIARKLRNEPDKKVQCPVTVHSSNGRVVADLVLKLA